MNTSRTVCAYDTATHFFQEMINVHGPYCDASNCYYNWDGIGSTPSAAPYAADINDDHTSMLSSPCTSDVVSDQDEWLEIFARGRQFRRKPVYWNEFRIYADTFNGAASGNWAPWNMNPQVTATLNKANGYPIRGCTVPQASSPECGGGECRFDTCTIATDCRNPIEGCNVAAGVNRCGCAVGADCFSGVCMSDGTCGTGNGTCACAGTTCPVSGTPDCHGGYCISTRDADVDPGSSGPWLTYRAPRESASLDGATSVIKITEDTAENPIKGINDRRSFEFSLEFFWKGFGAGETEHVLAHAGTDIQLSIVKVVNDAYLKARVRDGVATYFAINPFVWYRVRFAASSTPHVVLDVDVYNVATGFFDKVGCTWDDFTGVFSFPSTVRFGHDGSADNSLRFHGRLDNPQLSDHWAVLNSKRPTGCAKVP